MRWSDHTAISAFLAVGVLGIASPAPAHVAEMVGAISTDNTSETSSADDYSFDGPTKFVFGEPGELTVDAGHGNAAFPVPTKTLVFEGLTDFVDFMVSTFNATSSVNAETGDVSYTLNVTTLGIPYASDPTGTKLVQVDHPVSTFLGGPEGFYVVAGKVYCTDPARCPIECVPNSATTSVTLNSLTASSVTLTALGFGDSRELMMSSNRLDATALVGPLPYNIEGNAIHWPYWATNFVSYPVDPLGPTDAIGTYNFTIQSPPLPYKTIWCGPPVLVTLPNGTVTVTFPQPCSTAIINPNELVLNMSYFSTDFYGACRVEEKVLAPIIRQNVARVAYQKNFSMGGPDTSVSGVRTSHLGRPLSSPVYAKIPGVCWGAGCFTSDPCK